MPHSHHSHSGQFCKHASGSLEDVVKQAIAQGFEVFGLSEHVPRYRELDLYPEEQQISPAELGQQFIAFLQEAKRLKAQYAPQIKLLIGLETELITPRDLEELSRLLDRNCPTIEYVVGSIHHVNGIPVDFDEQTYRKALASFAGKGVSQTDQFEKFLMAYFDAQYELLQRFKPEIVGHIDLCRLYSPDINFTEYPSVWEKVQRNIDFAISYGALFEVNAAAFRKNWSTAYPGTEIAKFILKQGGRFALSDDSHGPPAVGLNYNRVFYYLKSLGVSDLWYLEQSELPNPSGRKVQPTKLENWAEHAFWRGLLASQQ